MRTDESVNRVSFRQSKTWLTDPFEKVQAPEIDRRLKGAETIDGRLFVHSLSGNERNHLFLNDAGRQFVDASLVSGADTPADSRGFATLDFDQDGLLDIALVNANDPLINLYRNNARRLNKKPNHFVAVRFVGGNEAAKPNTRVSCRDGFGAIVELKLDNGATIKREHRCGEGYGTQNRNTLLIGMGESQQAQSISVRWPSGIVRSARSIPTGSVVVCHETPIQGNFFTVDRYTEEPNTGQLHADNLSSEEVVPEADLFLPRPLETLPKGKSETNDLRVFVTMATWCPTCLNHLPDLELIAEALPESATLFALPVDRSDSQEKLADYVTSHQPPYRTVIDLTESDRTRLSSVLSGLKPANGLPSTIITDRGGAILYQAPGIPTVSDVKRALRKASVFKRAS